MKKASWTGLCMVAVLGACGGGGGDGKGAQSSMADPAATQDNTTTVRWYENGMAVQGESFTAKGTFTRSDGSTSTAYTTRYYQTVNADHSGLAVDTPSEPMNGSVRDRFAPDGATIANGSEEGNACTYEPAARPIPGTLTLGSNWDNSWTRTCGTGNNKATDHLRSTGSATALETITVAAGTFKTIKLEFTQTEVRDPTYSYARWEQSEQCWVDVVMGVPVKCTWTLVKTPRDTQLPPSTSSTSYELVAYDAARFPGSSKSPARFAGGWTASLAGANAGNCASITIDISGKLTGSCTTANAASYQIDGIVDAEGVVNASAPGGITISGKLTPVDGTGNWSANGGDGTWSMVHK